MIRALVLALLTSAGIAAGASTAAARGQPPGADSKVHCNPSEHQGDEDGSAGGGEPEKGARRGEDACRTQSPSPSPPQVVVAPTTGGLPGSPGSGAQVAAAGVGETLSGPPGVARVPSAGGGTGRDSGAAPVALLAIPPGLAVIGLPAVRRAGRRRRRRGWARSVLPPAGAG